MKTYRVRGFIKDAIGAAQFAAVALTTAGAGNIRLAVTETGWTAVAVDVEAKQAGTVGRLAKEFRVHDVTVEAIPAFGPVEALGVIAKDPIIAGWLAENDPKALEQVNDALKAAN